MRFASDLPHIICLHSSRSAGCRWLPAMARNESQLGAPPPIQVVLFDAFDTLLQPRKPPHAQYAEEARNHGLQVEDDDAKRGFREAFKQTNAEYPLYGSLSQDTGAPSSADAWWLLVISRTLLAAGQSPSAVEGAMPRLGPALLERFSSSRAYKLFDDVQPALSLLQKKRRDLRLGLASNSDAAILQVLSQLGVGAYMDLTPPVYRECGSVGPDGAPTLSYYEGVEKPAARFFHAAARRNGVDVAAAGQDLRTVLYVGDQEHEDYWGAKDAGLRALWLQRGHESNQPPSRANAENTQREDPVVIRSLLEILKYV